MKTLDEVIESIIKQSGLEIRNVRKPDRDRFWVDRETYNDALHYLKEHKTMQIAYIKGISDIEDNPPLTWDELTQMEGKPVWVEHVYYKKWLIVKDVYEETIVLDGNGFYTQYFSDDNEKETRWQAYRKERG